MKSTRALNLPFHGRHAVVFSVSLIACLAAAACAPSEPKPNAGTGGSSGSGGSSNSAGSGGSATATGGAGGSPTQGSTGGSTGAQGGSSGSGGAGGTTAATGGTSGGTGDAGAADTAGGDGGIRVSDGPPAYSTKPMSVVAYSPFRDGQAPGGAQPTRDQVKADLVLLKPFVDGIRVYGTDGANGFVPALCDELGIDLHLGAWIDGLGTDEANVRALAKIVNEKHPSLKTAIIGNEVLERATKMRNNVTEARLIELINIAKAEITVKTVKIAAADTYPEWMKMRPQLADAVDLLIWHTYAYWAGADISNAAALVSKRYDDMLAAYPGKLMLLGETGWPTQVDRKSMDMTTTAVANEANQARFYRESLATMRARNLPMWMFSAIDEKWKATSGEGEVGAYWGFFTTARQPKAAALEMMAK